MVSFLTITICLFLAYANGANDNFKGVATLFGSKTTKYKTALYWATITTILGSLVALVLAKSLITTFSGKGLVPDSVVALQSFSLAVSLGEAFTVMLATLFGFPVSTTHALTGALCGAGILASPSGINFEKLGSSFFLPLILSPCIAFVGTVILYPLFRKGRLSLGIGKETCVCVGNEVVQVIPGTVSLYEAETLSVLLPTVRIGNKAECFERYSGQFFGVEAKSILDCSHFLSSGLISFARGLNDTPKIAALLIATQTLSPQFAIVLITIVMALGGLFNARKVADKISMDITKMNDGQGFTANLFSGLIIIAASRFGMPVSTTHVSCGALFGIGAVTGNANLKTITSILAAWITTLPVAALLSGISFYILKGLL